MCDHLPKKLDVTYDRPQVGMWRSSTCEDMLEHVRGIPAHLHVMIRRAELGMRAEVAWLCQNTSIYVSCYAGMRSKDVGRSDVSKIDMSGWPTMREA